MGRGTCRAKVCLWSHQPCTASGPPASRGSSPIRPDKLSTAPSNVRYAASASPSELPHRLANLHGSISAGSRPRADWLGFLTSRQPLLLEIMPCWLPACSGSENPDHFLQHLGAHPRDPRNAAAVSRVLVPSRRGSQPSSCAHWVPLGRRCSSSHSCHRGPWLAGWAADTSCVHQETDTAGLGTRGTATGSLTFSCLHSVLKGVGSARALEPGDCLVFQETVCQRGWASRCQPLPSG